VDNIKKALQAIKDGYEYQVIQFTPRLYYIKVENPKFKLDDGSDEFMVIEVVG
jgi:hypothetical protein